MKRAFFLILSLILLLTNSVFAEPFSSLYTPSENELVFNQSTYKINVIDPVYSTNISGANYPGLRGANQLVIYTPAFGYRTNTNEFGTEAIVEGNTVVSLSGADSLIPVNGFVISGHGRAKQWINENIIVGSKISIDSEKNEISSYITSGTFLFNAQEKIKEVQNMMSYYTQTFPYYNPKQTEANLNKAKDFVNKAQKNVEDSQKYSSKAIEYANSAISTVIPYNPKEMKGIWVRPTFYTEEDIEKVLNTLSDAGINNIFLETFYHGKTISPSATMEKYGFIKQYETYEGFEEMKEKFLEIRKGKATVEDAEKLLRDVNYFGVMLVKLGLADGMVSGAIHSTADTVRPALQIIKTKPGISRTSGVFLMNRENTDHRLVFADCAINIEPNAQELAEIAINTAETAKVFGIDPKVAMLSFSTKGSAKSPKVDRVVQATNIAKEMRPDLAIDGELQFDAAFVPATAAIKAPDSNVAGHANVFVFPGLQAGNIGYKIAQRLGMFEAIGPILQGLNKPVNDLSRGASAEDIYNLAIITAAQALNG